MKIYKSTPHDLLRKYGAEFTKNKQKVKCYVNAIAICTVCDERMNYLDGYDEVLYHECDSGNVVSYPKLNFK